MNDPIPERPSRGVTRHRPIALAIGLSILLHLPLLLSSGAWRLGTLADPAPRTLHVQIEPPQEPQDGEVLSVAESNDPVAVTEQRLPAYDPQLESFEEFAARATAAMPDTLPIEVGVVAGEASAPEAAAPPAEDRAVVIATVAPVEESVLARRVVREAHALLHAGRESVRSTFETENGTFSAVLTRLPAADGMGLERVAVEIATESHEGRVSTRLSMKRLAFSHFTQLIDRWDPWVQLHDDEIAGRFHSNTEIVLTYDHEAAPRLLGKVTTARGIRITGEEGWRPRSKIFVGGLETRTPRVRLPPIALPVANAQATRDADVHVVRADSTIQFRVDGAYERVDRASGELVRTPLAPQRQTYIVATRDAELAVRGIVKGNVTVYSPRRIVVVGDLTYAHGTRLDGENYLGLVSDGNIEIDRADLTGPGDLDIHAALYARQRFVVRNVRARRAGTLSIYGSLTAGSISETEPRYATRIEFDPRLEHARPPGFPETDRYEVETWDRRWRLAEGPEGG